MMSAAVAGPTTPVRPSPSYTTLRDVTVGGRAVDFDPRTAIPKLVPTGDFSYEEREDLALQDLDDVLRERRIRVTRSP